MKPRHPLLTNAGGLRRNCTDAERLLWSYLRKSQIEGIKFRRQEPVENYVVDFLSFAPRVIVELDGSQHAESKHYDRKRDACLRRNGFTVVSFWNNELTENLNGVLEVIRLRCIEAASPTPQPPPARGGGSIISPVGKCK